MRSGHPTPDDVVNIQEEGRENHDSKRESERANSACAASPVHSKLLGSALCQQESR